MQCKILSDKDLQSLGEKFPENCELVAFKIVKIGPQTLSLMENSVSKISELVDKQPGFFLIGSTKEDIKEAMLEIVNRFCDLKENKE